MCGPLIAALAKHLIPSEGGVGCGEESEEVKLLCAQVFEVVLQKTPQVQPCMWRPGQAFSPYFPLKIGAAMFNVVYD